MENTLNWLRVLFANRQSVGDNTSQEDTRQQITPTRA